MVKRCLGMDFSDEPLPSFLERTDSERFLARTGRTVSERERDGARDGVRDGGPGYAGGGGGGGGGFVGYAKMAIISTLEETEMESAMDDNAIGNRKMLNHGRNAMQGNPNFEERRRQMEDQLTFGKYFDGVSQLYMDLYRWLAIVSQLDPLLRASRPARVHKAAA